LKLQARQRAAAALLAALTMASGARDIANPAEAERELSRIGSVIRALEREIGAARANRSAASKALERHERAIAEIARQLRRLEATAGELEAELARLRATERELRGQVDIERDALGKQLRAAYGLGREAHIKLLLQDRDPGTLDRLLRYHGYLSRERRERIAALESTLDRLLATERAISEENRRLAEVREQQTRRRQALESERERRREALVVLDRELRDRGARLASLGRDRERLESLLERLRQAIDDIPPELEPPSSFASLHGRLPWPVQGRVATRFGTPRQDADLAWQGVVLEAPAGREVRAVAHGRVVFADWLRGFGQMIIVDHGNGYMSLYGHNRSLLREPGEWVSAGDALAEVGVSGGHQRPGLYFEIRHDGQPEDPARWCSARARFRASL
jgi:septal ring factor EnvC (AmiA/AmiB activator)